jgi:glycosyltransferase involved in cell wall biosynthesis
MTESDPGWAVGTHPSPVRSVLFVTYHFPPEIGGVNTRVGHYVRELRRRNIDVTVLVMTSHGTKMSRYMLDGAEIFVCPGQMVFFGRNASLLARVAFSKHVDVIHVVTGAPTAIGSFALLLGRAMRIPTSISFFGTELFEDGGLMQTLLQPFTLSIASSISVNSPHTGRSIPAALQRKTHVLLGGAEASESAASPALKTEGGPILFVGRLVERKGGDDLISAFRIVKDRIPDSKLVFVGAGPDRKRLDEMARALNLSNDVEFRGVLTGQALHDAYEESSVVVLPSKYVPGDSQIEGLGLTLIEGSMHAKPLVATRHGGMTEVVKDGVNGLMVPENNPAMLAEALLRILSDEKLAARLGKNALAMAESKFSWRAATDRLLESYTT